MWHEVAKVIEFLSISWQHMIHIRFMQHVCYHVKSSFQVFMSCEELFGMWRCNSSLTFEYNAKAMIFLMTYFNVLNLTVQECTTTINGSSDVIEKKTSLLVTHLLKSFHMHLLFENYLWLWSYM